MQLHRLYQLLQRLDGREFSWFDKFLASPYFNSGNWPQRLWAILRPAHPRYENMDREWVFEQLCPGEPFDRKFLNSRYSELSRLAEEFFFQQELQQEGALRRRARRSAYRRRNLFTLFSRESRRQAADLQGQPYRSPANLAETLEIFNEHYLHPEAKSHSDGGQDISHAMEQLDLLFVLLKLKYRSDQLARRISFEEPMREQLMDTVLNEAARLGEHHPAIGLYYRLVRLFQDGCSDEGFQAARDRFYALGERLPTDEQSFLLAKFITLAYRLLNQGRQQYLRELFELYRYGEQQSLFIFHGAVSDATFLNVCTVAAQAGHYEWAWDFTDRHRPFLPAAALPDAAILGQAIILFAQEEYQSAYQLLNQVYKKQSAYKLRVRSLYVRCLLGMHLEEPRYEASLRSALDAFAQFIRRNRELSAERKAGYLHFAKAARKIALLRSQDWRSGRARAELREWLDGLQPLILGAWLRKQLESE